MSPTQTFRENVDISRDVDIHGAGASNANLTFLFGDGNGSVVRVKAGSTVNLAGFLIQDRAVTTDGDGSNAGTLTVTDSYVSGNSAVANGGAVLQHRHDDARQRRCRLQHSESPRRRRLQRLHDDDD